MTFETRYFFRAEQKESKKAEKQAKSIESESAAKAKDTKEAEKEKPKEESKKDKPKEEAQKEKDQKPKEAPKEEKKEPKKEPKTKEVKEEEKKDETLPTPLAVKPAQNWSDLFFIIDSLSYNIDMCDFILFMTKIHPIPNIDVKKVNADASYLETTTNTLVFSYTDAGIMEQLLGEFNKLWKSFHDTFYKVEWNTKRVCIIMQWNCR